MKPDRLPSPQSLQILVERLATEQPDLELFVLKAHLIVERQMYWLLAHRLEMEERHLPSLQYFPLAKVALGGERYKDVLLKVLALNDARNEFGHELDDGELERKLAILAGRTGTFWPETDPVGQPELFKRYRDASARIAALSVSGDVWACIVELSLARNLYPDVAALEAARSELERFKQQLAARLADQNAKRAMWQVLTSTG
jgi:hypothetical protein